MASIARLAAPIIFAILASPRPAQADDLLFATDGKQLFTVDTQTGALTFVSDGTRQWLASPAFDQEHHTRLWITGLVDESDITKGVQFDWGNPFTGERAGPYPASVSYFANDYPYPVRVWLASEPVYAPTTQRLYVIGQPPPLSPFNGDYVPIMIDQYNGSPLLGWGRTRGAFWDQESPTAVAFDFTSGLILQAYSGGSEGAECVGYGVRTLDPYTGYWGDDLLLEVNCIGDFRRFFGRILAIAAEPTSGDWYFVVETGDISGNLISRTLVRRVLSTGEQIMISDFPPGNWSMVFADRGFGQ
jgi:hypothetical protein